MQFRNWLLDFSRRVRQPFPRHRRRTNGHPKAQPAKSGWGQFAESLEERMRLSGVQTFGDCFASLQRSSGDGTTLDFSAVTGSLVFTISGDSVTVAYADANLSDSLTYSADGQDDAFIGSQGSDQYLVVIDGQLASNRVDDSQNFMAVSPPGENAGFVERNGLTVAEESVAVAINRCSGASDVAVDCAATPVTGSLGGTSQEPPIARRLRPLLAKYRDRPH